MILIIITRFKNKTVGFGQRPRPLHVTQPLHPNGTFSRWGMDVTYNRYKFVTVLLLILDGYVTAVSLLKPPCGGIMIETATWIQKQFKISV
jgi:hypothetical protein